jgi:hypothetical protein
MGHSALCPYNNYSPHRSFERLRTNGLPGYFSADWRERLDLLEVLVLSIKF